MLRYEKATRLVAEAIATGRELRLRPLAVAVLDPAAKVNVPLALAT